MVNWISLNRKKGMLLPEAVLKLLLSVLSILILVGLLTALFFSLNTSDKLMQAEAVLKNSSNSVQASIKSLENGENVTIVNLDQPLGWHVYPFTAAGKVKPNQCGGNNCLCICKDTWNVLGDKREEVAKECSEGGSCLIIEGLTQIPEELTTEIKSDPEDGYAIGTINLYAERLDVGGAVEIDMRIKAR